MKYGKIRGKLEMSFWQTVFANLQNKDGEIL